MAPNTIDPGKTSVRSFQFSLRSLIGLVIGAAILLALFRLRSGIGGVASAAIGGVVGNLAVKPTNNLWRAIMYGSIGGGLAGCLAGGVIAGLGA